jgi:uracil-DNA glycosylase
MTESSPVVKESRPSPFDLLMGQVRQCHDCAGRIPEPRPVVRAHPQARLLIVGQAPGLRVHRSGIPWNDPSGDTLRRWLQIGRVCFYDPTVVAILPVGFCYPGRGPDGDLPPRPECAARWREPLLKALPNRQLTLLIGHYAHHLYEPETRTLSVTETVSRADRWLPRFFMLPHPSPRNRLWFRKHPWFEGETLPKLRILLESIWNPHP